MAEECRVAAFLLQQLPIIDRTPRGHRLLEGCEPGKDLFWALPRVQRKFRCRTNALDTETPERALRALLCLWVPPPVSGEHHLCASCSDDPM